MFKKVLFLSLFNLVATTSLLKAPWGDDLNQDQVAPAHNGYALSSSSSQTAIEAATAPNTVAQGPFCILLLPDELLEFISQFLSHNDKYKFVIQTCRDIYRRMAAGHFLPHRLIEERIARPISCGHRAQGPHDIVEWWLKKSRQKNISPDGLHETFLALLHINVFSRTPNETIEFTMKAEQHGMLVCATFAPNNQTVAVGTEDGRILLWDLGTTNQIASSHIKHSGGVGFVKYSPKGNELVSLSRFSDLIIISDSNTLRTLHRLCHNVNRPLETNEDPICSKICMQTNIEFLPNNTDANDVSYKFASFSLDSHAVIIWAVEREVTNKKLLVYSDCEHRQRVPLNVTSLAFSMDGELMVVCNYLGDVKIFDANSGQLLHHLLPQSPFEHAFLDYDGNVVGICKSSGGEMWKIAPTLEEIDEGIAAVKQAKLAFLATIEPGSRVCCR